MFKLCFQYTGIAGVATVSSLTGSVAAAPSLPVCHNEVMEVVLNCWARGGYGLIVHRNQSITDGQSRCPLFISYIEKGSPADKCGILQVGDRVLAINDWCAANGTVEEANYVVRHATGPLSLTVEFDVIDAALNSGGVFTVKLAKRGNLGIVIANSGSAQKGDPVIVSDVGTGSVAHRSGAIQPDDQLLAIDNIPLDTCTVDEASRLLQRTSDIVKLRIKKTSGGTNTEAGSGDDAASGQQNIAYTVELNRKSGPLGLTIAGTDDRLDPIFISQLAPGGLAEKTGAFRIGDRILSINGQSLNGKRVSEALQVLHQGGDTVRLQIARSVPASAISLNDHSALRHHVSASTAYGAPLLTAVSCDRPPPIFHEHFSERGTADKLGTPVQSIDSAVESLEDAPLIDTQQASTNASHRNSSNSKSSSLSGGQHSDFGVYGLSADELATQLQRSLNAIKNPSGGGGNSQGSRQSDAGSSSVSNAATDEDHYAQLTAELCPCSIYSTSGQSLDEWIRVLDALEAISEAEMLRKLEEIILASGATAQGVASSNVTPDGTLPLKAPPKPQFGPPFPSSNPLLKQSYPASSRLVSTSYLSLSQDTRPVITVANSIPSTSSSRDPAAVAASILTPGLLTSTSTGFSPSVAPSAIRSLPKPLTVSTILTGHEHIPFITTPVPSRSNSNVPTASSLPHSSDRPTSPQASTSMYSSGACPSTSREKAPPSTSRVQLPAAPTSGSGETNVVPLEIIRVTLSKDKLYNDFGFSVSDGVQDKGVYINKIRAAGPADLSGYIKPLDRILQVNSISLQDLDCLLAVPLLAAAGDAIDLVLCRDPVLAATYRSTSDSIEEENEDDLAPTQTTV